MQRISIRPEHICTLGLRSSVSKYSMHMINSAWALRRSSPSDKKSNVDVNSYSVCCSKSACQIFHGCYICYRVVIVLFAYSQNTIHTVNLCSNAEDPNPYYAGICSHFRVDASPRWDHKRYTFWVSSALALCLLQAHDSLIPAYQYESLVFSYGYPLHEGKISPMTSR